MSGADRSSRSRTLVLGVGNLLAGDDGFGVHAVRRLRDEGVPDCVDLEDGGTGGVDLLELMTAYDRVILIDLVRTPTAQGGDRGEADSPDAAIDSIREQGSGTMGGLVGGDQTPRGPVPGEVVTFRLNRVEFLNPDPYLSLHGCSLGGLVRLARALDVRLPDIDVVGYLGGRVVWSTELSAPARRALDEAVKQVRSLLAEEAASV